MKLTRQPRANCINGVALLDCPEEKNIPELVGEIFSNLVQFSFFCYLHLQPRSKLAFRHPVPALY